MLPRVSKSIKLLENAMNVFDKISYHKVVARKSIFGL